MIIRRAPDIPTAEITGESQYFSRREWLASVGMGAAAIGVGAGPLAACAAPAQGALAEGVAAQDELTPFDTVTGYNNYYEFGINKDDPAKYARTLQPRPWSISVEGMCGKPGTYDLNDLLKGMAPEERVYRMRCVEGWSMVVPWNGVPLRSVIDKLEPMSNAKFVEFHTLYDPKQMPRANRFISYPYVEGLRLDEARHPLTLLVHGVYGKTLPNQNGAPLRLIVPWKYGFKGGKSINRIRFVERAPRNSWQAAIPSEYGFYANVNPEVDHPRWTQASERRLGEFFKRKTLMFNGYADQVASLYTGMDLRANF